MKIRIVLGEFPWKHGAEPSPVLEEKLFEIFAQYQPSKSTDISGTYGYQAYELAVPADDPQFEKLSRDFDALLKKANPPSAAFVEGSPDANELKRARFLEPYYFGSYVEQNSNFENLNPKLYLCEDCQWPNFDHLPEPFIVNKSVLKKYDVFNTKVSVIIVRSRVLELLKNSVGDQIQYGEAVIEKTKEKAADDDRLFWVRPKLFLGSRVRVWDGESSCSVCKRVGLRWLGSANDLINRAGPGLLDNRYYVEHYGSDGADIALIPDNPRCWPDIVMSGALLAHLKANDVKGIVASTKNLTAQCFFSKKCEPTLEAQARTFAGTTSPAKLRQDKAHLQEARKTTAGLKDVPWDCESDGHVYFHLTTPEFIVLDPMTGEDDSGGPYVIKDFKGPGLYRLPVSAIKAADEEKRNVAVDSATLLLVDNTFLGPLLDEYEWDKAVKKGEPDWNYHQQVAEKVGTRFGICTVPPDKFKSDFIGDGFYRIDPKRIRPVKT